MKWLTKLFTSKSRKMLISNIGDLRHQVELSNLQICRLASKIKDLTEAVSCLTPDEQKEERTGGECIQPREGSNSHVCMRGDVPMDERDYSGAVGGKPLIPKPTKSIKDTRGLWRGKE